MSAILNGLPERGDMAPGQESDLATRIQKHQREEDRNELVTHNLREAVCYGVGFSKGRLPEDEILSVCYLALSKAARNFKPGGIRFFAYAKPYVRGEICLLWKSRDVVRNSSKHETELHPIKREIYTSGDREEELTLTYDDRSLEINGEPVEPEFAAIDLRERWAVVEPLMRSVLNERERMILELSYIGGFTFEQLRHKLVPVITRTAVQHTHTRAIRKLRSALSKNKTLF
jgi:RNA polymerase sigma factor (sigma-70 family)